MGLGRVLVRPGTRVFLLGCLATGLPVARAQVPAQAPMATTTLRASEDAFVASARADTNFGREGRLHVGERTGLGATRTLVYFDLERLPRNQVVLAGTLRLYVREAGPSGDRRDIVVRRVTGGWNDERVTWNNFPAVADAIEASASLSTDVGWRTWEVNRLVRRWYTGQWVNEGVYVQGYEAAGSYRTFDSDQGTNRPELVLEVAIDSVPPIAAVSPLPQYTNASSIALAWTGHDPEPASGIDFYRLWVQRDTEPWSLVAPELRGTTYTYAPVESGRRYGFRVDAVDRAGNVEPEGPAEAWVIVDQHAPTTTIPALPSFVRGPFDLTWTSADNPRPPLIASGVVAYDVQIREGDGPWGDFALALTVPTVHVGAVHGKAYAFRARAWDAAGNAEAYGVEVNTRVDALPPVVWFTPPLAVVPATFPVLWHGTDPGASGIDHYDIQVRVDAGPWTDWLVSTRQTRADFSGAIGHVYAFRGRARDVAGNVGAYPDQPQVAFMAADPALFTVGIHLPVAVRSDALGR